MSATSPKRSVLITGCTPGGIGHALALEFHKQGCHVIATARRLEVLKDLEAVGVSVVALDVTSKESISACREKVETLTGGRLDILVNNAGRTHTIPATDADMDDVRDTYEANVFGPMAMCSAFIRLLIPARGLILNISSISSVSPYLFGGIYSSTKGALNTYSAVLRMELRPFKVRVMVAMTGTVKSNIANHFLRTLPEDSIYKPVNDRFQDRLTFSQKTSTMSAEAYASEVVGQALKGEGWFGGWLGGTPDWYWTGGLSSLAWATNAFLPKTVMEAATYIFFKMPQMAAQLAAVPREKKE